MAETLEKATCTMSIWLPNKDGFSCVFDSSWAMPREEGYAASASQLLLMRISELPPPPPLAHLESADDDVPTEEESAALLTEHTETDAYSISTPQMAMEMPDRPITAHETIIEWEPVWSKSTEAQAEDGLMAVKGSGRVSDAGVVLTHLHQWQENPSRSLMDVVLLNGLGRMQMNLTPGDHLWHARPLSTAGGRLSVWSNKTNLVNEESHFSFAPVAPKRPAPADGEEESVLVPKKFLRTDGEYITFSANYSGADAGYKLLAKWKLSLKSQANVQMWCDMSNSDVAKNFRLRLVKLDDTSAIFGNVENCAESSITETTLPIQELSSFNLAHGASEEATASYAILLENSSSEAYGEGSVTIHWWLLPKERAVAKEPSAQEGGEEQETPAEGQEGEETAEKEEEGEVAPEAEEDPDNSGKFIAINEELPVANLHRWSAPLSETPLLSKRIALRERLYVDEMTVATLRVGIENLAGAHVNFRVILENPPTTEMRTI